MSVNKKDIVMKNVNDLVPDPNQPRTIFKDEDIENTANTMLRQGVINPIEIDEHNMIVTGEVRWRAAKFAKIEMVPCTVWKNGNHKRFERQAIENLNQHHLEEKDRNATIVKLWETKNEKGDPMYPSMMALGKAVGLSVQSISAILSDNKFRQRVKVPDTGISMSNVVETADLDDHIRVKILVDLVSSGEILGCLLQTASDAVVSPTRFSNVIVVCCCVVFATLFKLKLLESAYTFVLDDFWGSRCTVVFMMRFSVAYALYR